MTILAADIKLLQSERMADTIDGGGRQTATVIPDGVAGNIFPKVSRLDSVYGRVNLRKIFAHVDTSNSDTYAGAHVAIIDAADNDKIKVNIFSTGSDFDVRSGARDRIESYVISGPQSRMQLYGRQLIGQQAVTCVQRVEDPLPEVGTVFCLSNEVQGVVSTQQYVRTESVEHEVRTFTDQVGDFSRRVVTLKLSTPLRYEFVGIDIQNRYNVVGVTSLVRNTTVADAARYFGIQPIRDPALAGAITLTLDSIYSPIVPTTQREAPISNAEIGGAVALVPAGTTQIPFREVGDIFPLSGSYNVKTQTLNIGTAIVPGSLRLQMGGAGNIAGQTGPTVSDDGNGHMVVDPIWTPNGIFGSPNTVDYESGIIVVNSSWGNGQFLGTLRVSYIPAVNASQAAHNIEMPVTLATRGTIQVATLTPLPAKGSVFLDYRALGKWYRLRDDGTGLLKGDDAAYGTGSVDFVTGAVVSTLGALPDVGSSVIIGWASPKHYTVAAGAASDADPAVLQRIMLDSTLLPVNPLSLTVKYTAGTTDYVATTDVNGVITGNGITGTVNTITGEILLRYTTRLPNAGSGVTVSYQQNAAASASAPTERTGLGSVGNVSDPTFLASTNIHAKGLHVLVPVFIPGRGGNPGMLTTWPAVDNGAGSLVTIASVESDSSGNLSHAGGTGVGSVDYNTGIVTINLNAAIPINANTYYPAIGGAYWRYQTVNYAPSLGDYAWKATLTNTSVANPVVTQFALTDAPLQVDLTKTLVNTVIPGSVNFTLAGRTYFDRNGVVYYGPGAGTAGGTIDYKTGSVSLSDFVGNVAPSITVSACLTQFGKFTGSSAAFRTAGSPLRPASTFVQVTAADGEVLSATCDQNGVLTGNHASGTVNQQMGLVSVKWGDMVAAAGNESQPWYDAAKVVAGMIFKPREIMPESIRYNTVVLSNLPVNADILGLDPVRLPSDGRVPIYRPGDVVLVHNTKTTELANPVVAGATYSMGRSALADLVLHDANGVAVPANQYAVDLAGGTLTMAADMALGALVQPLKAKHRIEELTLTTDVQINGQISLASALSRDFDEDTFVSSALLFGDMFSRVSNIFDQVTWTGEWSDARIGSNGVSEFNSIAFPIEVKNDGAVTERWRISFTSTTAFQVIGENLGVIATGSTNADCVPVNPLTGKPYFAIRAGGWGGGWVIGQQLRFNTYGATGSVWMVRTVLPGAALNGDSIDIQVRGDVDA